MTGSTYLVHFSTAVYEYCVLVSSRCTIVLPCRLPALG